MRSGVRYVWDQTKAIANIRKHGIAFETAVQVFADPFHVSAQDRVENGEHRWQTLGNVNGCALILVAHTWTDHDGVETVRIISARRAEKQERKRYEQ